MCGRYTLRARLNRILDQFAVEAQAELHWEPRYNIAPTQEVPIVRHGEKQRELVLARWGLIPSWAKDDKIGYSTINARADTVADKPAFRSAFKRRRCLVPVDGYYEWLREGKHKQPFLFETGEAQLFAFAGLWERWKDVESYTIITTDANEVAADIHNRMPVILHPRDYDLWLDPAVDDREQLEPLLVPFSSELTTRPVSAYVNNARHEGAECVTAP